MHTQSNPAPHTTHTHHMEGGYREGEKRGRERSEREGLKEGKIEGWRKGLWFNAESANKIDWDSKPWGKHTHTISHIHTHTISHIHTHTHTHRIIIFRLHNYRRSFPVGDERVPT